MVRFCAKRPPHRAAGHSTAAVISAHARNMGSTDPHSRRLIAIQAIHSVIFWAELGSIVWLVATGIRGRRDRSVGVAATLVAIESAVFVANDRVCPLTPLAERFGATRGSVSDIWLPDAVARTIPYWTIPLVALGASLHLRGMFTSRRVRPAR